MLLAHWTAFSSVSGASVALRAVAARGRGVSCVQLIPLLVDRHMWPLLVHRVADAAAGLERQVGEILAREDAGPGLNELPFQNAIVPPLVAYQKRVGDW